ncbi:uncharacterized protein (TIGR03089 family) [Allocatelliglobosispora scoriae]|uniref:Uncharacterized protein (TIGR03089 family) n=1 Tax=Allocatelliglobosispora scoriae TaxID=643052 RepID=A0A841BU29_9ACTN|nr:TIGR03089 family protein [Allocatelliglobosispora scoriae]MBB5870280.1 uncharacterized protein (TIGR03089 family) [Allocatelliglobosispora scoriae]
MTTVRDLFARAADPAQPRLTWYDDATGERTELSTATLANWTNKTANLLVDGLGLGPGSTAVVALPPHWQTAAVLLGCAAAGVRVVDTGTADVGFATLERLAEIAGADERLAVSLHPFALPMRDLPGGVGDWALEARQHGDFFSAYQPMELEPREAAAGRVLIDTDRHPEPSVWLWAPLAAGSSIVACSHTDVSTLARKATSERVTIRMDAESDRMSE